MQPRKGLGKEDFAHIEHSFKIGYRQGWAPAGPFWRVHRIMTPRPSSGPIKFTGSFSKFIIDTNGPPAYYYETRQRVSFVFDSILIESDRSEPIKASAMAGLGGSFIEPGSADSRQGENKAVGADPQHRVVVSGQLHGGWQVITSEAGKAFGFSQNIVNEMLAYGPESGPDRVGKGHKMRSLQCLRQRTKETT
jgi:hypothetical protein